MKKFVTILMAAMFSFSVMAFAQEAAKTTMRTAAPAATATKVVKKVKKAKKAKKATKCETATQKVETK